MAAKSRKKRRARRRRILVIIAAALIILLALGFAFGQEIIDAWKAHRMEEDVQSLYYSDAGSFLDWLFPSAAAEANEAAALEEPAQQIAPESTLPPIHEDFARLYEVNPHVIGWLKLGERIDYPVVHFDNVLYLDHDFYGDSDNNGTLFVNEHNSIIPRDDVLLIHGHNMKSGAMFGTLKRYEDLEYVCRYPIVSFRTVYDAEDVFYVPIAAFHASMEPGNDEYFNIMQTVFMDDFPTIVTPGATPVPGATPAPRQSSEYQAYLDSLLAWSMWESPADVCVEDELLMLVTCSYYQDDGRFMLVCRKLREGETVEGMQQLFTQAMPED